MEIRFEGPRFYAPADEDRFFDWLRSLPEFERIEGRGTVLNLHVHEPLAEDSVRQLLVVFRRWQVDVAPLLPLKTSANAQFVLWNEDYDAGRMK